MYLEPDLHQLAHLDPEEEVACALTSRLPERDDLSEREEKVQQERWGDNGGTVCVITHPHLTRIISLHLSLAKLRGLTVKMKDHK